MGFNSIISGNFGLMLAGKNLQAVTNRQMTEGVASLNVLQTWMFYFKKIMAISAPGG